MSCIYFEAVLNDCLQKISDEKYISSLVRDTVIEG